MERVKVAVIGCGSISDKYMTNITSGKFSILELDSICLHKYPQFRQRILDHAAGFNIQEGEMTRKYWIGRIKPYGKKVLKRIIRQSNDVRKFYDVTNISQAADLTMEHLSRL